MADGIFYDEKKLLAMGWPLDVVEAIRRVFEADAVQLDIRITANTVAIVALDGRVTTNEANISTNTADIALNTQSILDLETDKADKVSGATLDNVATLLANGNYQDSGVKLSDYVVIIGTGSPEGVVTANQSLKYIDSAVPTEYYNPVAGANTGWVAL